MDTNKMREMREAFERTAMNEEIHKLKTENEALRKYAERYRWLQKATPYRFTKTQEASTTDGGDVFYFHADRFDGLIDEAMAKEAK